MHLFYLLGVLGHILDVTGLFVRGNKTLFFYNNVWLNHVEF